MKEKTNSQNRKGFKVFLVFIILLILLLVGKKNGIRFDSFISSIFAKPKTLNIIKTIPLDLEKENIEVYEDQIIRWNPKKIKALKLDGSINWERNITFEKPLVFSGDNYIYFIEKATGDVYFLDSKGEVVHKYEARSPINNAVEKNGFLILFFKNPEMENINVLDKHGKLLYNTHVKGEHIISICVNDENTKYIISTLDVKDENILNTLHFFEKSGQEIGSINFGENLILYIQFIDEDNIIVSTDKEILCANNEKILWKKNADDGKDIYFDKVAEKIYLLYNNRIEILSLEGKEKKSMALAENYKKIVPLNKNLLLYGDDSILILDDDREVLKYKSEEKIEDLKIVNSNIVMINSDEMKIMKVVNKK